jgi:7-cyano-7-deazaguanine synthase
MDMATKVDSASVLVLAGGGIDSTACISKLLTEGFAVRAVHIDFGQAAAAREWSAVGQIGAHFNIETAQISVSAGKRFDGGYVEGRNAFFIFLAVAFRRPNERLICLGIHAGTPFYDCTGAFLAESNNVVASITDGRAKVIAPLLDLGKPEVVEYCRRSAVPLEITYSCQKGAVVPCGKCLSCQDRRALRC